MSRFEMGGAGEEIPLEALPDPTVGDLPPIRLLLDETGFDKTDFESLGYTHYEVYCIGAMGGRGGDVSDQTQFTEVQTQVPMSPSLWADYLDYVREEDRQTSGEYDHDYIWGPGDLHTAVEETIIRNPGRLLTVRTYTADPLHPGFVTARGGGGGGGGLHYAAGLIADLDTVTDVVIGEIGSDGALGQSTVNGPWTPTPELFNYHFPVYPEFGSPPNGSPLNKYYIRLNQFIQLQYKYPSPLSFYPPTGGSDGGASSFGGTLARASGGKGGGPALTWPGGVKTFTAYGGNGGEGDTATAGGGGAGATGGANGSDGGWDGNIGEGGGGGRGGKQSPAPSQQASSGGQGSYSFADTTFYGNRGVRDGFIPGGGGGAKVGSYKYGGAAVGWNPGGAVIIRLTAPV